MKLIDTHAHLQFKAYDEDRDRVVAKNSKGLEAVVNVGAKIDSSEEGVELAQKIPNFYAAAGVHPHHVDEWQSDWISKLEILSKNPKVVAIGETGLDNHEYQGYPKPNLTKQVKVLMNHIELAKKQNLPLFFHCRDAYDELYEVIKKYDNLRGVVHCFMGNEKQAKKFLNLDLFISFTGNITYKGNGYIREVAKVIPLDKILIETDAPYLPPEPHRGTRNEPIYVKIVAETIAQIKDMDIDKLTSILNKNSIKLLHI